MRLGEDPSRVVYAAVAELADALDSKSSGSPRAGSSPASGIEHSRKKSRKLLFSGSSGLFCFRGEGKRAGCGSSFLKYPVKNVKRCLHWQIYA